MTRPAGDGTMDNMPELTEEQKKLAEELRQQRIEAGLEREVPQRAGGGAHDPDSCRADLPLMAL